MAQSPGTAMPAPPSTLIGETGPLLWMLTFTVTLKGWLGKALAGAFTPTLGTLTSVGAETAVVSWPLPELLPRVESEGGGARGRAGSGGKRGELEGGHR